ncbi:hypothetical protein HOG98_04775 [bacterium]|jgi:hypothetical protein|nr:hypothetical protein [bacterium]
MAKLESNKHKGFFLMDMILSMSLLSLILLIYPTYLKHCYDIFIQSNRLLNSLSQMDLTLSNMSIEPNNRTLNTDHPLIIKKEFLVNIGKQQKIFEVYEIKK